MGNGFDFVAGYGDPFSLLEFGSGLIKLGGCTGAVKPLSQQNIGTKG
jgi:hypothetical protein